MNSDRTIVTFRSSRFNYKEIKDYFINSENFGDDLAQWLAEQLERQNVKIYRDGIFPGQEDFGWFFNCHVDGDDYCIVIGHHYDGEEFEWIIWIERRYGMIRSILGHKEKKIKIVLPYMIHAILSSSGDVSYIRWHRREDFERGRWSESDDSP